jgi:type II secretory pathway component PulM
MTREKMIASLAAAACVLGIVLTADSVIRAPQFAEQMKRKYTDLDRLLALRRGQSRDLVAIDAFDQLPAKTPVPLGSLVNTALPDHHAAIHQRETRPAAAGWSIRSVEISFDSVKLDDLARFLAKAEEARPPWRLAEFNVTALEQSPACGRVSVVLEALEKTGGTR